MKKIALVLAEVVLVCCLCGCKKTDTGSPDKSSVPIEAVVEKNEITKNETEKNETVKNEDVNNEVEANVGGESLSAKLIREIEGAYHKEAELSEYSSTIGMIELADKYTEKWKQVADEYYNKIMEYNDIVSDSEEHYSSEDLHTFVSNMKTNWEQYNQVQCDNYSKTLRAIYNGGTIVGPIMADYKYENQKEWALQLVEIYQQL